MTLKDLAQMFNRSLAHSFGLKKFFCLFLTLILSGLIFLFFQAISTLVGSWFQLLLKYIPLFVIIGFIMAAGTVLIRFYAREREGEKLSFSEVAWQSWDLVFKASFLALPLLLAFLIFWILIGLFLLLKAIPYLGAFFGVFLAFAPFLLNLGTLILLFAALLAFFFVAPPLATTEKVNRIALFERIKKDLFTNLLLLGVAYLPVWIVWEFIGNAAGMTFQLYTQGTGPFQIVLRSLFMMLPFVAILSPAITFFFNFAYEAYLHLEKELEDSKT